MEEGKFASGSPFAGPNDNALLMNSEMFEHFAFRRLSSSAQAKYLRLLGELASRGCGTILPTDVAKGIAKASLKDLVRCGFVAIPEDEPDLCLVLVTPDICSIRTVVKP